MIMVSGGFDPPHIGHVRMFKEAAKWGDVVVAINSDEWLMRKKGYVFMPWEERAEIIKEFASVDIVVAFDDSDVRAIFLGSLDLEPDLLRFRAEDFPQQLPCPEVAFIFAKFYAFAKIRNCNHF